MTIKNVVIVFVAVFVMLLAGPVISVATVNTAEAAEATVTYVVQRGDTLSRIAQRFGVTVAAIQQANNLRGTTIYVGQRLMIPGQAQGGHTINYTVQSGDTLSSLARRYATTVDAIMRTNRLTSTNIFVGQRLTIVVPTEPLAPPQLITVQAGDTLFSIARRYGTTVAAIQSANGLGSSTRIFAGQRLVIPMPGGPVNEGPINTQRIQFAAGKTSATVSGRTQYIQRYQLRAMAGQEMTVQMSTATESSYITVLNINGLNMAGSDGPIKQWSGVLPATGDYTVEIISPFRVPVDYSLTISIVTPSGTPNQTGEARVRDLEVRNISGQYHVIVRGDLPDACSFVQSHQVQNASTTFRIQLTTARHANMRCAPQATPFEYWLRLDTSGLPHGQYDVRVNEFVTFFDI